MYPLRVVRCPSQGQRAMRCAPGASRAASSFFPGPHWRAGPRGHPFAAEALGELNPWVRALDEQMTKAFDNIFPNARQTEGDRRHARAFEPRFDVRETENAYELRGELPGVAASDLHVEFTDPNTLVISGSTESETTHGTSPAVDQQTVQATAEKSATSADNTDAASVHSNDSTSSYVKPSVEDEDATQGAATPATEAPVDDAPTTSTAAKEATQQSTYWMNERATGSFRRTFRFAGLVNLDAVSANLKNGVLDLIVPKVVPESKRITVN